MTASKLSMTDAVQFLPSAATSSIPQLGFGVYLSPPSATTQSCLWALQAGYRHIDTAQYYENEAEVGAAVHQFLAENPSVSRSDIFLTTKILISGASVDDDYAKCVESITKLNNNSNSPDAYVDAFLIHSPNFGPAATERMWTALERLFDQGKAKTIGVSNCGVQHIEQLKAHAKVWPPHINQIELHPWAQQRPAVEYCQKHNIVVEAYCPIARNQRKDDKTLVAIADKHSVQTTQVLIRYALQKGWVPLPKSDNQDRIKANADVYGFELDADDMKALDGLDEGHAGAMVQSVIG